MEVPMSSEIPAMPPAPAVEVSPKAPAGRSKYRKYLIYGAFLLLVLILVVVVQKQKAQLDNGFSGYGVPDGRAVPTPCSATDHAKVISATYQATADNKVTNVAANLQKAYSAQQGNAPYTVNSATLLGATAPTPGKLTFRAECPSGRVH